jgi:phosphotransferase system HPr (HPr) family protein
MAGYDEHYITVSREDGLHARPSVLLSDAVTAYGQEVFVSKDGSNHLASGSNTLALMCLDARQGSRLRFQIAPGPRKEAFLRDVTEILSRPDLL